MLKSEEKFICTSDKECPCAEVLNCHRNVSKEVLKTLDRIKALEARRVDILGRYLRGDQGLGKHHVRVATECIERQEKALEVILNTRPMPRFEIDVDVTITVDNSTPEVVYCIECGEKIPVDYPRWRGSSGFGYHSYQVSPLRCKNGHGMGLSFGSYGG